MRRSERAPEQHLDVMTIGIGLQEVDLGISVFHRVIVEIKSTIGVDRRAAAIVVLFRVIELLEPGIGSCARSLEGGIVVRPYGIIALRHGKQFVMGFSPHQSRFVSEALSRRGLEVFDLVHQRVEANAGQVRSEVPLVMPGPATASDIEQDHRRPAHSPFDSKEPTGKAGMCAIRLAAMRSTLDGGSLAPQGPCRGYGKGQDDQQHERAGAPARRRRPQTRTAKTIH